MYYFVSVIPNQPSSDKEGFQVLRGAALPPEFSKQHLRCQGFHLPDLLGRSANSTTLPNSYYIESMHEWCFQNLSHIKGIMHQC